MFAIINNNIKISKNNDVNSIVLHFTKKQCLIIKNNIAVKTIKAKI